MYFFGSGLTPNHHELIEDAFNDNVKNALENMAVTKEYRIIAFQVLLEILKQEDFESVKETVEENYSHEKMRKFLKMLSNITHGKLPDEPLFSHLLDVRLGNKGASSDTEKKIAIGNCFHQLVYEWMLAKDKNLLLELEEKTKAEKGPSR